MSMAQNKNYKQALRIFIPVVVLILLAGFYMTYMPTAKNTAAITESSVPQTQNAFENAAIDHIKNDKLDSYFVTAADNSKYQIHFIQKSEDTSQIQADGFSPGHRISLRIDKKIVLQSIPTDWAGRTEFDIPHKPGATVCLILNNQNISICNPPEKTSGGNA